MYRGRLVVVYTHEGIASQVYFVTLLLCMSSATRRHMNYSTGVEQVARLKGRARGGNAGVARLQIEVDGHDLKDLDAAWYRGQLGVVSQDARLFTDTVYNNIAYGAKNVNKVRHLERPHSPTM